MSILMKSRRGRWMVLLDAILCVLFVAAPSPARDRPLAGGNVMPAVARAHGYSLTDLAAITAYFNTTDHTNPALIPRVPFQILDFVADSPNTFTVSPGTMLYVPVVYSDNSAPVLGDFPDVTEGVIDD